MKSTTVLFRLVAVAILVVITTGAYALAGRAEKAQGDIVTMVYDHARAWETGDRELLSALLHDDVVFAYPGRRLNKQQTLEDLDYFKTHFSDTKVYINKVIIDGDDLAVEWQFATTLNETGKRQVVSDAIIGKLKDGKFVVWKEYLDGRVKDLQAEGKLELEEGQEPFPFPKKTQQPAAN